MYILFIIYIIIHIPILYLLAGEFHFELDLDEAYYVCVQVKRVLIVIFKINYSITYEISLHLQQGPFLLGHTLNVLTASQTGKAYVQTVTSLHITTFSRPTTKFA